MSKVLSLDYEHEHDYKLFGINSTLEDFRLAYFLNKDLQINLERQAVDLDFTNINTAYTLYHYDCNVTFSTWSLVSNKYTFISKNLDQTNLFREGSQTSYLINEKKNIDFFLKIFGDFDTCSLKSIQEKLKNIKGLIAAYPIDPNLLKSKDFLIFLNMRNRKKTKIVATLGPACNSKEIIEEMMTVGVNVFRVNFSHADYDNVAKKIEEIREINKRKGYNVAVLADLQGPKLRVGVMKDGVKLKKGDTFVFTTEKCEGNKEKAFMTYQNFPKDVQPGEQILVDDGKLLFKVIKTNGEDEVTTEVLRGGKLTSKKGVNLPNTKISLPALTDKDIEDALFAIKMEVDWIALSFVRNTEDLIQLRTLIDEHSTYKIPIIAKIEKPEAVAKIKQITAFCDGLMVARGDLGVEVAMEKVPLIQKKLVLQAKQARIPVIIATQMMETMINSQVPTRAEVNDVANSIMDGADAVMLSGETSVGEFPVEVIKKIRLIIENVEDSPLILSTDSHIQSVNDRFISKTICHQAATMAEDVGATVISTLTNSGYTAFQISAWRPKTHILAFSSNRRILAMLNLLWGVKAQFYDKTVSTDDTVEDINIIAKERGYAKDGDYVINLTSMPVQAKGMVNTLRISKIDFI